jgi:transposase
LEKLLTALQEIANIAKMIDFNRLAADGFFSAGKGGGENVEYGYKGKGVTSHVLTDEEGNPLKIAATGAAGDEREQVTPLLKKIVRWLKPLINGGKTPIFEADKGYDAIELRIAVLRMKIFPMIPYRRGGNREKQGVVYLEKQRWKVERAIA